MVNILVIDDDALVRETIRTMLQLEGHEVALAPHGEDGLRRFREQAFDIVICDIFMPRKGGMETVAEIRRISPDVPIIAMTGGAGDVPDTGTPDYAHYLHLTRLAGATTTIAKPFRPRDLFALIGKSLGDGKPSTP